MLRDAIAHTPEAATTFIKTLRGVFKYAMGNDLVTINPAKEIEYLHKKGSEGFHTWSDEESHNLRPIGQLVQSHASLWRCFSIPGNVEAM
jgi:hypothetical protein